MSEHEFILNRAVRKKK